eukprot:gene7861-9678_t
MIDQDNIISDIKDDYEVESNIIEIKNRGRKIESFLKVVKCEKTGADIYIVGTNHVSEKSNQDVRVVLDVVKPDRIFLELCADRSPLLTKDVGVLNQMKPKFRWYKFNLIETAIDAASLSYYYTEKLIGTGKRITGEEMRIGYEYARDSKGACKLTLGDRNNMTTFNRMVKALDITTLLKGIGAAIGGFFYLLSKSDQQLVDMAREYNERLDNLEVSKVKEEIILPKKLEYVIKDERDFYMASVLRDLPSGKKIVAIVGKGHVEGIANHINDPVEGFYLRQDLEQYDDSDRKLQHIKFIYPSIIASGYAITSGAAVSSLYFGNKFIRNKSMSRSTIGKLFLGCMVLELGATSLLINKFQSKFDRICSNQQQ